MNWKERDSKVNWHPFSPLNDGSIIPVVRAEGSYLFTENGDRLIDMVSSWWVNLHGHNHPHLMKAIREQTEQLDHVIFAGFTHPKATELSERLLDFVPGNYSRVFYSDDGSTANEVALKMALQYFQNKDTVRTKIIAFENAYHGDTFGAMSMGGRSLFNEKFSNWMMEVIHIPVPVKPYSEEEWNMVSNHFNADVACFIFEPLLQGAAGMIMYDKVSLDRLMALAKSKGIITIADEVLTGFGRTGKWFASDYLDHKADILCLSKGITGGVFPLGVTLVNQSVVEAFSSGDKNKILYHGHSYTANALSCAVACANLDLLDDECLGRITDIQKNHSQFISGYTSNRINSFRVLGTVLAMNVGDGNEYTSELRDNIYSYFIKKGLLMRPLGNVIYTIPPFCIDRKDLDYFYRSIEEFDC